MEDCDKCVVMNTIQDSYMEERKVLTVSKLLAAVKEK